MAQKPKPLKIYANGGGFVSKSRFKDCFATALRKPALLAKTEKNDEITQIFVQATLPPKEGV